MRIDRSDIPPFLIGLAALPAQAVLVRELLARGGGNELALTVYLVLWLLGSAAGARVWERVARGLDLRLLLPVGCLVPLLAVVAARFLPQPGATPGEIPSPLAVLLWGACVLLPAAIFTAGLFPVAAACVGARPGRAYMMEALGSIAGGAIVTVLVIARAPSLTILSLVLAVIAIGLGRKPFAIAAAALLVFLALAGGAGFLDRLLVRDAWQRRHPGLELIAHAATPSRSLVVAERDTQRWLFADDALQESVNDPYESESIAALLLGVVPRVDRVLLVGFGGAGLAGALHPGPAIDGGADVPNVTCLLADRQDTILVSPVRGVSYLIGDPRARLRSLTQTYDVIAISGGHAAGIAANRLWTVEAFRSMAERLSPRGAIIAIAPGGEAAPAAGAQAWRESVTAALAQAAGPVQAMDADRFVLAASGSEGLASLDADSLAARLRRSGRTLASYPPERFAAEYPADRRTRLSRASPNRDARPAAVAFALRRWARSVGFPGGWPRGGSVALCALIGLIVVAPWSRGGRTSSTLPGGRDGTPEPSAAGTGAGTSLLLATGAASMGLDLLVLMAYQARVGILHAGLGVLLGAFLGGAACGAALAERVLRSRLAGDHPTGAPDPGRPADHPRAAGEARRLMIAACAVQASLALAAGLLLPHLPVGAPALSSVPYAAIAALLGMTCGFPFPVVARATTAGRAWSIDAFGGILGSILFLTVIAWGSVATGLVLGGLPLIAMTRALGSRGGTSGKRRF